MAPFCKNCHHPAHRADCGVDDCGCIRYEPKQRRLRQRTWLVTIRFFERNRWMPANEVRVQASGIGGAALKAVRQVKAERASRRRISQTRIDIQAV